MSTNPPSRREFLTATAAGLAGASFAPAQFPGLPSATTAGPQDLIGDGRRRRILLRGGVVLSLDPRVGDFERADVLIDGKLIAQISRPTSPPAMPKWSIARARSSCPASSPRTITSTKPCSGASSRMACFGRLAAGELRVGGSEHLDCGPDRGSSQAGQPSSGTWDACRTTRRTVISPSSSPV